MYEADYLRAKAELEAEERTVMWEALENMAEADGWSLQATEAMGSYLYDSLSGRPTFS